MDVGALLNRLGLGQYERAFRDNDVDSAILRELTADDLIGLGVTSIGHRRKLLGAIAALRDEAGAIGRKTDQSPAPAPNEASPRLEPSGAERRQITIMFCDLVGSTALSTRLDPEDLQEVIDAYLRKVAETIDAAGGFVARYMGDGVLAYFGYPQAHEDDAERAVSAGLAAVDAVARIDVQSVRLQARVGIATGLVVVGALIGGGSAQEKSVVGETPNLAARLQALAEPGAVVIAASTQRLVGALFEYREMGHLEVKGIAAPVLAWHVLHRSNVASRFEALRGTAMTMLVGRDNEIALLQQCWTRAKAGDGQVVLISGEPGVGKSRLGAALEAGLHGEPHLRLRYFCSPYHQDSALQPVADQLRRAAEIHRDDPPATKLEKLAAMVASAGAPAEDVAFLADLLSLPAQERHPLPQLTPRRKKERLLEVLLGQLEGLAREQPVLIVFEDLHWIDPTSLELLDLTIKRVQNLSVLLLATFRPEFLSPWNGLPRVSQLTLNRLDRRDRTSIVLQIAGKALPDEVVDQIVDRSDGVPLFIEELTKSILDSDLLREEGDRVVLDRAPPHFAIPTSLSDSLMARLDRLGSARYVAQMGAAVGREFSYALLRMVSHLPDDQLQAALARLVAAELVFQHGTPPDSVYSFKHALLQDAAHASLLRRARQRLHAQIAAALEADSAELMQSQPELFALHYAEAGLIEKSVACWERAGRRSAARSAMAEAAAQLQKGLDQLARLPNTRKRQYRELEFYTALGAALRYAKGQAAPEMGNAFARARELWEQLGAPSEFLYVPCGQSRYHMYRGEFDLAQRLDEDLLRLSRRRNDSAGLVLGHQSAGRNLVLTGKFAAARSHLEEVLALYDPSAHGSLAQQTGSHPRVGSQGYLGIALFCLGFPDQALAHSNAAIVEARQLAHPPSLAASLAMGARLLSLCGDTAALAERAGQLNAVATEQGFPSYRAMAVIYDGWIKVNAGELAEGISLLRSGSSAYRATGAESRMPYYAALLARATEIAGHADEASILLGEALHSAERIGERWFMAELYRYQAELMLRNGDLGRAEELYRKALAVAAEQEAKLWELRAAGSLARLFRDRGRRSEARGILAPIYAWFTEGLATPDLREAKALLDELR